MASKKYILDQSVADKKLKRMALEIIERNPGEKQLILAGIGENGSIVARCIQQFLKEIGQVKTELITITLNKRRPKEIKLSNTMDFNDKVIIVIDDVANSGKTLL